jgi:flavorubredoxin
MDTRIDEVGPQLYRIATPIPAVPGGFSFNQYLLVDDEPLLFHTGGRGLFETVRAAIGRVMPVERLRWISFSHVESDECGALNPFLAVAPQAQPLCGQVAAMVSMNDLSDRAPRALANGETLSLGKHSVTWIDAPHVPHGWECGFLFERTNKTLFCGDLFTQGGTAHAPVTDADILEPSEGFRRQMDYYAHGPNTAAILEQLAATEPATLACMHGSAYRGDGGKLIRALAKQLG